MDHSSRWVNGSSQGLSYAIVTELFMRNQQECLILPLSRHHTLFLLSFHMLSNDISASDLVIEVDCCEMTICNSKLIISLYYWAEMQAIMTKHSARKQQTVRQKHSTPGFPVSHFSLCLPCSHKINLFFDRAPSDHNL